MGNSSESNRQHWSGSLRRSLLLSMTATALIPMLLLAGIVLYYLANRAAEDVTSKNQLLARAISGQVEVFLRAPESNLLGLRNQHLTHKNSLSPSNVQVTLDSLVENSSLIESIYILNRQGVATSVGLPRNRSDLRAEFSSLNLGHLEFIKQAWQLQQPVWSDTFLSIISGKISLALAIPANDIMIVGNIEIEPINCFIKDMHQEELVESTIVDRHGEIIACSRQSHELCPANLGNLPPLTNWKKNGAKTTPYEYRGISFLGSIAQVKGPGWLTLVTQMSTDAYQPVRRTSFFFLGVFLVTSVVILLVAILTSKRVAAPIQLFAKQARKLADGDYGLQQLNPGYTEIAVLANDFQHMAERIATRERDLINSEEAYRTLAENLPAIAYRLHIHDGNRLQFMNDENLQMTGFKTDDFNANGCLPFVTKVHPDDLKDFITTIEGAIAGCTPFTQEYRFKHADGEYRVFYEKGCPVYDSEKKVSHIDGVIFDITERKQAEDIVMQSEKMLTVGGLAAGMAHEINNPLAGILQNCQLIQQRLDATHVKNIEVAKNAGFSLIKLQNYLEDRRILQMLDAIKNSGLRAASIVENILDFSRKGQEDFIRQSVPELIDKALELACSDYDLQKEFDFRSIEIDCQHDPNLPHITCEPTQIQQVLLNIFKNGAQAMSELGSNNTSKFMIRSHCQQNTISIRIIDNGPGIPAVVQKRIFEPFFTTKEVGKGTGLGLSVCYFIITEKHHGNLEVSSTLGKGTEFTISLPHTFSADKT